MKGGRDRDEGRGVGRERAREGTEPEEEIDIHVHVHLCLMREKLRYTLCVENSPSHCPPSLASLEGNNHAVASTL